MLISIVYIFCSPLISIVYIFCSTFSLHINLILVSGVVEKEEIKGNMGLYQIIERRTSNHGNGNQRIKCINNHYTRHWKSTNEMY